MTYKILVITILAFVLSIFFFSCEPDEVVFEPNPFESFDVELDIVDGIKHTKTLVDKSAEAERRLLSNYRIAGDFFHIVSLDDRNGLVFSPTDQRLTLITHDAELKDIENTLVAEGGRGPDEIDKGIHLYNDGAKTYLVQRNRVSIIENDNGQIKLNAIQSFGEYLNYYSTKNTSDTLIINSYKDDDLNMKYLGESDYYTMPVKNKLVQLIDGYLYSVDNNLIDTGEG
ncbi:MAG: hypothetical protein FH748_01215 [Balneolaceae bacterium]|nr:hypothetical protein [Balneolaceae bacterium]